MRWPGSSVGAPERVSVIPGNHDIYSRLGADPGSARWAAYMTSDAPGAAHAGHEEAFPFVRMLGPVALIGVNSAVPTPPLVASGRLGSRQLARVAASPGPPRRRRRLPPRADPPPAAAGPGQTLPRSGGCRGPGGRAGAARGRARHPRPQPSQHAGLVRHQRRRQGAGGRRAVGGAWAAPQGRAAGPLQPLPHCRAAVDHRDDRARPREAGGPIVELERRSLTPPALPSR